MKENQSEELNKHEQLIDSLGLSSLVDESKWHLYCVHIDDTCAWRQEYSSFGKTYFSSLPLKIDFTRISGDTIDIAFNFYYNDTLQCNYNVISNFNVITDGVGINYKTKQLLRCNVNRNW